jgi:hypothetical protein
VKIDREIVARRPQPETEREIWQEMGARRHDHLVNVRIGADDGRRQRLDQIAHAGVRKVVAERSQGGRGEDDVANLAEANKEDSSRRIGKLVSW